MILLTNKKLVTQGCSRAVVIPKEYARKKDKINVLIFEDNELRIISEVFRNGL